MCNLMHQFLGIAVPPPSVTWKLIKLRHGAKVAGKVSNAEPQALYPWTVAEIVEVTAEAIVGTTRIPRGARMPD